MHRYQAKLCTVVYSHLLKPWSALYVQCTVYSVQCTVYSVQCTVYSVLTVDGDGSAKGIKARLEPLGFSICLLIGCHWFTF